MTAHVKDDELVHDDSMVAEERARLHAAINGSLDEIQAGGGSHMADFLEELKAEPWMTEVQKRFEAHDAGETKAVPWAEARERIFAKP